MDASVEVFAAAGTDALGRRSGARRLRTVAEKRQIVEETLQPGASVATVARAHEVNANLVFGWRKLYQSGLLEPSVVAPAVPLLPVQVTSPTVAARQRSPRRTSSAIPASIKVARGDFLEVELAGRAVMRLHGKVAERIVQRLVDDLWPR